VQGLTRETAVSYVVVLERLPSPPPRLIQEAVRVHGSKREGLGCGLGQQGTRWVARGLTREAALTLRSGFGEFAPPRTQVPNHTPPQPGSCPQTCPYPAVCPILPPPREVNRAYEDVTRVGGGCGLLRGGGGDISLGSVWGRV